MWYKTIIHPILKKDKDYRDPLGYRAISLMSTITKLLSYILNTRITNFLNVNGLLCDEQNGFRKLRSCLDHIYTLTTIIRNRKLQNKPTFLCFVDFSKAFDSVNRDCLWYKLMSMGVSGNMLQIIKKLYENVQACVRVNNQLTDWFSVDAGVRQGDNLAPTLFAVYVNDVTNDINNLRLGVPINDNDRISILLYADDIVLIAETADDLQRMLDTMHTWTYRWRLQVNASKTKTMHCRKPSMPVTDRQFKFGNINLECVNTYRYLGFHINEHLNYANSAKTLKDAGSRSLGALTARYFSNRGLDFKTFEKLYQSTVTPVTDYASGVWGYKLYDDFNKLQHRAIRSFLGVSKSTCLLAIDGEVGWLPPRYRRHLEMVRLWHRLTTMNPNRLTYRVFQWDLRLSARYRNTWCNEVKQIFTDNGLPNFSNPDLTITISSRHLVQMIRSALKHRWSSKWAADLQESAKLRTYRTFKDDVQPEPYLEKHLTIKQRSAIARFRCGSFPLAIELGRYRRPMTPLENRVCRVCDERHLEDERHFLVSCTKYADLRVKYFGPLLTDDVPDRLKHLITNSSCRSLANYVIDAYERRCETISN
ncbi:MAG: reverse transcriptase family protein [Sedimenticola sp.]